VAQIFNKIKYNPQYQTSTYGQEDSKVNTKMRVQIKIRGSKLPANDMTKLKAVQGIDLDHVRALIRGCRS